MSTINLTGWETGDLSECKVTSGTLSVQSTTTAGSWSAYALRCNPITTALGAAVLEALAATGYAAAGAVVTSWVRFKFLYATKPASASEPFFAVSSDIKTGLSFAGKLTLYLDSGGHIVAKNAAGTTLATGTTVLSASTWYRIEVKCGTGSSTAAWEVKINGTSEASGTSNLSATNAKSVIFGKAQNANGQSVDFYYDDALWSDSAYPGNGRCAALLPNANGSLQTWTVGAGSGSHYQIVNQLPPPGDTSYLNSPASANQSEIEALAAGSPLVGAGSVNCVKSVAVVEAIGGNGTVRIRFKSNATYSLGSNATLIATPYTLLGKLFDTDPATLAAWVGSGLDTLQSGAEDEQTDLVSSTRMTFTAAMVDYAPSTGALFCPSPLDGCGAGGSFFPNPIG